MHRPKSSIEPDIPHPPPMKMFVSRAFTAAALAAGAFAAPSIRIPRADPDCTTQYAGVLSAPVTKNGTATFKSFTPSSLGQTAYLGDGKSPLVVQFQHCTSLNLDQPPGSSANIGASGASSSRLTLRIALDRSALRPRAREVHSNHEPAEPRPAVLHDARDLRHRRRTAFRGVLRDGPALGVHALWT